MKAAVDYLEPHMEKSENANKGTVILATVKGDVHDIGKNLVDIILSNNGYTVENLGIKVPPEELIRACREHSPDAVGLSGLLVKSAQQMVVTAEDLESAGIEPELHAQEDRSCLRAADLLRQGRDERIGTARPGYGSGETRSAPH
jgi:5-methyltetrahydrofolate--homocysteine methyltransferase